MNIDYKKQLQSKKEKEQIMAIKELKDKNRKIVAYMKDASGSYLYEVLNDRRVVKGYIKEAQARIKYEIQAQNHGILGYAEYFSNKLELKDKSRRVIAKLDSKLNITDDSVLLTIVETYFQGL
jgi:hypothetical protein